MKNEHLRPVGWARWPMLYSTLNLIIIITGLMDGIRSVQLTNNDNQPKRKGSRRESGFQLENNGDLVQCRQSAQPVNINLIAHFSGCKNMKCIRWKAHLSVLVCSLMLDRCFGRQPNLLTTESETQSSSSDGCRTLRFGPKTRLIKSRKRRQIGCE